MAEFDENDLKRILKNLSDSKQLAFILLLCERMMPAFSKFSEDTKFDMSCYRKSVDIAWAYLAENTNLEQCEQISEACCECVPDTEEFDHALTSAALNAALAVGSLMAFLSERNVDRIVEAAGLARDTLALQVQSVEAAQPLSLTSDELVKHPLMQQEARRQADDLMFLASLPDHIGQKEVYLLKARTASL